MQDAFTGGVLWVSLGKRGQGVRPGLNTLVSVLSSTPVSFESVDEGAVRLAELLESRDCLLVLDDVWDEAHAAPFLQSPQAARLITTRSADIASAGTTPTAGGHRTSRTTATSTTTWPDTCGRATT